MTILIASGGLTTRQMIVPVEIGTFIQRDRDARSMIYITAVAIEVFREAEGRLPRSLEEIGEDEPEIVYMLVNGGYRLEMTIGEFTAGYSSGDGLALYRNAMRSRVNR